MAGSVTIEQNYFSRQRMVICHCTSDASGDVSGIGFQCQGGNLYGLLYIPESGASDLFDLTTTCKIPLKDGSSIEMADCLDGEGANLSNSTDGDYITLAEPFPIAPGALLTPVIANLGNAQSVYVVYNIWEEVR